MLWYIKYIIKCILGTEKELVIKTEHTSLLKATLLFLQFKEFWLLYQKYKMPRFSFYFSWHYLHMKLSRIINYFYF